MWLISNPLFEIGAGLVLFAATIWMLLNAIAPRPHRVAAPARNPAPPAPLTVTEAAPALGPLAMRPAKAMFFAEEVETPYAEPPLRLTPNPAMLTPAEPLALAVPLAVPPAAPLLEPPVAWTAPPILPEPEPEPAVEGSPPAPAETLPEPEPIPSVEGLPEPPATEVAETVAPEATPTLLEERPALAEPALEELPETPAPEPLPAAPFDVRFRDWLEGVLHATPGAPALATVTGAAVRVKRAVDPAWPEPARDLRATLECLGKLSPAVFAAPGARGGATALADEAGPSFALIWPEPGAAFDPTRHEARSGEGDAVASVVRPGVVYAGATALPALVVRGSAAPSSATA